MDDKTDSGPDQELREAWRSFRKGLAGYLAAMTDDDHLLVQMPAIDAGNGLATPYAQFAVTGSGGLRAELSGNSVLVPSYRLDEMQLRRLVRAGWTLPDGDEGPNLFRHETIADARRLALLVSRALEKQYAVPHPTLMTVSGWGPHAEHHLPEIGLAVDEDFPAPGLETPRDQLLANVSRALDAHFDQRVGRDAEGDFELPDQPRNVYVRVAEDFPAIEVFSALAIGVRSRRQAVVEVSLLNRDHALLKFVLHGRTIVATMSLPAPTLEAAALVETLPMFLSVVNAVRDDLTLRTGAR